MRQFVCQRHMFSSNNTNMSNKWSYQETKMETINISHFLKKEKTIAWCSNNTSQLAKFTPNVQNKPNWFFWANPIYRQGSSKFILFCAVSKNVFTRQILCGLFARSLQFENKFSKFFIVVLPNDWKVAAKVK